MKSSLHRPVAVAGLFAALLATACNPVVEVSSTPNLILIIGDDHGWPDFGFMGSPIVKTPHLDALASGGTTFPNGFTTASTCRPALASLLTGLHPVQWNAWVQTMRRNGVHRPRYREITDFITLPKLLGPLGYSSFQGGKYWEGAYEKAGFTHGMRARPTDLTVDPRDAVHEQAGGSSLVLGRSTMQPLWDFIDAHRAREEEPPPSPFFVWFAPMLPHIPHDAPGEFLNPYLEFELSRSTARYYANITRFDARLGDLVRYLDEAGLRENTLLVYLSDNGWDHDPQSKRASEIGGVKGKASMHEMGFRTPIIFNWPGVVPAGQTRSELVSSVDLFPTLLDFAGGGSPANRPGVSLHPLLTRGESFSRTSVIGSSASLRPPGTAGARRRRTRVSLRHERAYFFRNSQWRYIWYPEHSQRPDRPEDQLFRIDEDARETRDVAAANPQRTSEFRAQIKLWRARTTLPFQ
jgi:uncharacterized sulfatase